MERVKHAFRHGISADHFFRPNSAVVDGRNPHVGSVGSRWSYLEDSGAYTGIDKKLLDSDTGVAPGVTHGGDLFSFETKVVSVIRGGDKQGITPPLA